MNNALRELRAAPRQHIASLLVVTVAALFGVTIIHGITILSAWLRQSPAVQGSGTAVAMIAIVGVVFFVLAIFVSALVIANTFGIIVAGRTERIALLRLIGASAGSLRRSISAEGMVIGTAGALLGGALGTAVAVTAVWVMESAGVATLEVNLLSGWMLLPVATSTLVTWGAAYVGSRRVLSVSPVEATGQAREPDLDEARTGRARHVFSVLTAVAGTVLLVGGVVLGQSSPLGILVALFGGMLSFTGLVLGSAWLMPPAQRMVAAILGRGTAGTLAARNAVRYPVRTSRTTIGLVIGITLVVMFATAAACFNTAMNRALATMPGATAEMIEESEAAVADALAFFVGLIAFSVIIAVIGVMNSMSLSVLQRTREIGLLRAVGLTRQGVRNMIVAESGQLTIAATAMGILLGVLYGWAGALSLLGALEGVGWFLPTIPWGVLGGTVLVAAVVVTAASLAPAGRAVRVTPMTALQTGAH